MDTMIKEVASINLVVIWLVILGGVAFVKIVKKRLDE